MTAPLVTTAWLLDRLGRPSGERPPGERTPGEPPLRIVDCRWRLGQPGAGEALWREGHIPGAAFLDVDRDLSAAPGPGGRHPLPSADAFEAAARRAGIGRDSLVVAYDEAGEGGAARLWWLLRHFAHREVTVLDGGLRAWREDGGELHAGAEQIAPGDFTAGPPEADTATAEDVSRIATGDTRASEARTDEAEPDEAEPDEAEPDEAAPDEAESNVPRPGEHEPRGPRTVLLDARAAERYRGEVEPIDPVAGHIPGAVSLPFAALAPDGRFLTPDELRARFEVAGVRTGEEVVAYCGSGVTAAVLVLAAEVAGVGPLRLYPGSWSEWSGRGGPVERG